MQIIERTVELENGQKVKFTAGPRLPFWSISFESGPVPKELRGTYTEFPMALAAVQKYVENREKASRRTSVKEKSVESKTING